MGRATCAHDAAVLLADAMLRDAANVWRERGAISRVHDIVRLRLHYRWLRAQNRKQEGGYYPRNLICALVKPAKLAKDL